MVRWMARTSSGITNRRRPPTSAYLRGPCSRAALFISRELNCLVRQNYTKKVPRMIRPLRLGLLASLLLVGVAMGSGCGGGQVAQSTISGKVTLDGQPVEAGTITFLPAAGDAPSGGGEIKGGTYTASIPRGAHKVRINVPKVVGEKPSYGPGSPTVKTYAESLPARFNTQTELKAEAKGSTATQDFDLKTK